MCLRERLQQRGTRERMTTRFTWNSSTTPHANSQMSFVVGHKAQLEAQGEALLSCLPRGAGAAWNHLIEQLSPGDHGEAVSTWLVEGDHPHQLVLAALPESCSRHNSPSHPHELTSLLKEHKPSGEDFEIIVALDHPSHATALCSAIARAFPIFSQKSSQDDAENKNTPHVSLRMFAAQKPIEAPPHDASTLLMEGVQLAARLVDMPTNHLYTDTFVMEAKQVADRVGASCTVIQGEELKEQGFGGLWGVGKAATHPPALVVLSYAPRSPAPHAGHIVWVGKGIVYDTGGLSIKTKTGMPGMKRDMGGAAAVLGAFSAAAQLKIPHNLHAVLCIAENAVGPLALRPDDIITQYSGRTVEINNTDAEGRLVLGDGVAYAAKHLTPDVIVDLATLTGAQLISTGRRHAAVMSNDELLEQKAVKAGRLSGDLVHPIPYCPEFFKDEFKSQVADLKNSVKDRANAQSSCAGQFVGEHLGDYDKAWLHIDLAGPSTSNERGTGFGVALLLSLFGLDLCQATWRTEDPSVYQVGQD